MAVVKGVNIPDNKRIEIALTSIYGIGRTGAKKLIERAGVSDNPRVKDLSEEKLNLIRSLVDSLEEPIEGDLRRSVSSNIKRLTDLGCYRGLRHRNKLPVRGQRTHTNARTRKGKAIPIAGKKKAV